MTKKLGFIKMPQSFFTDISNLSGSAVKVYFVLTMCNNISAESKDVFPSYDYIHEKTGLSTASISKSIKELLERGHIVSIQKRYNNSNKYILG